MTPPTATLRGTPPCSPPNGEHGGGGRERRRGLSRPRHRPSPRVPIAGKRRTGGAAGRPAAPSERGTRAVPRSLVRPGGERFCANGALGERAPRDHRTLSSQFRGSPLIQSLAENLFFGGMRWCWPPWLVAFCALAGNPPPIGAVVPSVRSEGPAPFREWERRGAREWVGACRNRPPAAAEGVGRRERCRPERQRGCGSGRRVLHRRISAESGSLRSGRIGPTGSSGAPAAARAQASQGRQRRSARGARARRRAGRGNPWLKVDLAACQGQGDDQRRGPGPLAAGRPIRPRLTEAGRPSPSSAALLAGAGVEFSEGGIATLRPGRHG